MAELMDKMVAEAYDAVNRGKITDAQFKSILAAVGKLRLEWKVLT